MSDIRNDHGGLIPVSDRYELELMVVECVVTEKYIKGRSLRKVAKEVLLTLNSIIDRNNEHIDYCNKIDIPTKGSDFAILKC